MPAPLGNSNALKHGLYARRITKGEREALGEAGDTTSLLSELELLRVIISRAAARLKKAEALATDKPEDVIAYAHLLGSLAAAFSSLSTSATRQAVQTGTFTPLNNAIEQFLAAVSPYITDQDG